MKNKGIRIVFLIIIIISCITLIAGFLNKKNNTVISETLKKSTYAIEKSIQMNELTEEVIDKDNSEYEVDDDGKLELVEYIGNEDSVIIPLEINEHRVEKINTQAFVDNQELEMIKIPVELEDVVDEIEKFEVNKYLSDNEYIVYSTTKQYSDEYFDYMNSSDEERKSYDFMPSKFRTSIEEQLNSPAIQELYGDINSLNDALPSSYDLRNYIPIKVENQENFGTCYAYSTLTSVETNLALKKNINIDFSEMHAAVVSRLGGGGGNLYQLYYKYFEKPYGPVYESQWSQEMIKEQRNLGQPFYTKIYDFCIKDTLLTKEELDDTISGMIVTEPEYYVISAYSGLGGINRYYKNNPQYEAVVQKERNNIKQYLMNYGAIQSGIADPNNSSICQYYNGKYVMYTPDESVKQNHGINIIGWDDNFSASNFPSSFGVTQNGAYLVLNTWGENWGNNGCFWISYQDHYIELSCSAILEVSKGKVDVNNGTLTLDKNTYEYNGSAREPIVEFSYFSNVGLGGDKKKNTDYTVSYSNNINAGTATVTIKGMGRYTGTATKTFTIQPKNITGFNVTLSQDNYTYDGTAKTPTVTVKDGDKTLVNGTDYTVEYSNNVNGGTATATITGKGNYAGTQTKNFTITAKSISGTTITLNADTFTYDGTAKTPTVTVKDGNKTLTNGTDYNVAYTNNTNVGTATVTITGKGTYTGTQTKNFTITAKGISGTTITLNADTFTYDGTAKTPTVTVKDGSKTLTNGTDYTVAYSNNTNVGTATVTITGKGTYTGTQTKNFTIKGMKIISTATGYNDIYDGNNHGISVNVTSPTAGANITYGISEGNYSLNQSPEYKDVGTYKVYYQITANNYETKTGDATIEIKEKSISDGTITLDVNTYVYDGTAKEPIPTVKIGDKALVKDTDYTVTYSNNVNAGTATVIVTGINNYNGSLSKDYTINHTNIEVEVIDYEDIYDSQEHGIIVVVSELSNGFTIKYGTSEDEVNLYEMPKYSEVGTYKIYYKIISNNYNEINGFGTVKIIEKNIENANINIITEDEEFYIYDKNSKEPEILVTDGNKILAKDIDYTVEYKDNINAGTGKIIVTGKGNYTGNKTETFEILKGNPDFVTPSGIITAEGKTLRDVKLPDNFEWEQDLDSLVGEVGLVTFSCKYIPDDLDNYNIVTGIEVSLTVMGKIEVEFENYTPELVENEENTVIYLKNIQPSTSIKDFEEKIKTNGTLKIYDTNESEVSSGNQIIKTGMKIKIQTDAENIEYILIVLGDVNGDGKFNSIDLLKLARYIDGIEPNLEQEFIHAGNVVADTKIDKKDCLKMGRKMASMEE